MSNEKELLLCPFCGSEAEHFERVDEYGFFTSEPGTTEHVIECSNKKCPVYLEAVGKTYKEAAKAWNTRYKEGEKMVDDIEQMKLVNRIDTKSRAIQKEVEKLSTSIYGVNLDGDEKRLKMLGELRTEALEFIGLLQDFAERIAGVDMEEVDER